MNKTNHYWNKAELLLKKFTQDFETFSLLVDFNEKKVNVFLVGLLIIYISTCGEELQFTNLASLYYLSNSWIDFYRDYLGNLYDVLKRMLNPDEDQRPSFCDLASSGNLKLCQKCNTLKFNEEVEGDFCMACISAVIPIQDRVFIPFVHHRNSRCLMCKCEVHPNESCLNKLLRLNDSGILDICFKCDCGCLIKLNTESFRFNCIACSKEFCLLCGGSDGVHLICQYLFMRANDQFS
jgi:hypothetical protein